MTTAKRCSEHVGDSRLLWGCNRKGKVFDQGKWWCTQHSPAKKAERRQKSNDRYAAQVNQMEERWAMEAYDQAAGNHCRALGLTIENLAAMARKD